MSSKAKIAAIAGSVLVIAGVAYFFLANQGVDLPGAGVLAQEPETCPLTGEEPRRKSLLDRPAVAVKIENAPIAYPLSGLEDADIVYEELVEGGVTRFMAIYHCADTQKAGPIRSARMVDPAIMTPITRILAFSGGNRTVLDNLSEHDIVQIEETAAGEAMQRIPRDGLTFEHTLYADSAAVRKLGGEEFDEPPPDDFEFGDVEARGRKARSITITFSNATTVSYEWNGERWARSQGGAPFESENHGQIGVDNVIVEEHTLRLSEVVDVTGTPSVEIADKSGSGKAVLFRDGRAYVGNWNRESVEDAVSFETKGGETMVLKPGNTWVHLVPDANSEVEGSFDFGN